MTTLAVTKTTYFALLQDNLGGVSIKLDATEDDQACKEARQHFDNSTGYKKVVLKSYDGVHEEKPEGDGNLINAYDRMGWIR